ncbi:glycosyltransferase family 4 protein [Myroides odoratimimus]|uniref:glycosyltransferase family 4 protein n=1 Tax=Myroides odoratimimus TaxID=76832 RepID=UPI002574BD7E|nr:glycosyltransferase family 4 protein [Myroides odoratimimus]MDM1412154.1 glycosyltransferase family 4 protein [Myroides odoratimimus]
MKVAVVFPYYAHYRSSIVKELAANENIDYYFLGGNNTPAQFANMKVLDMEKFNFIETKNTWFLKYFSVQPKLLSEIKRGEFDAVIIFADWKYLSTWIVLFYLRLRKKRAIFWSHGFRAFKITLNNLIKKKYFRLFDSGLVFDNRAKDILDNLGFQNIEVVYNSLDFDKQDEIYNNLKSKVDFAKAKEQPYVVFTGRLTVSKNLELILKAIHHLKVNDVIINLVLIGDGENRNKLQEVARDLDILNQVEFLGSCYDENIIANAISSACVSVIPSAVGLSAIHALTYGCPVITDKNFIRHGPEVQSIVENYSGLYYDFNDYIDLADKIKYFINLTPEERNIFSKNCRKMVKENYTANNQAKIIERMLLKNI